MKLSNQFAAQWKSFIGILISSILVFVLYSRININLLMIDVNKASFSLLFLGISLTPILGWLSSIRYTYFSKKININPYPKLITTFRSYFIVSCFNLIIPSKMGDLSKGLICERLDKKKYPNEIHIFTAYEKISDLLAILTIFIILSILKNQTEINNISKIIDYKIFYNIRFIDMIIYIFILLLIILSPIIIYILKGSTVVIRGKAIEQLMSFCEKLSLSYFLLFQLYSIIIWIMHILQMLILSLLRTLVVLVQVQTLM